MKSHHRYGRRQGLPILLAGLLGCLFSCSLDAATPVAKDFPSLKEAHAPIPSECAVLAFEENSHFLCADTDLANVHPELRDEQASFTLTRRVVFLKPSVWVVEDNITTKGKEGPPRRGEHRHRNANRVGYTVLARGSWTGKQTQADTGKTNELRRRVRVIQVPTTGSNGSGTFTEIESKDGCFDLRIKSADRVYQLHLPLPKVGAGRIAIDDAAGKTLVPLRPLPSGVLPHGEEGMAMIERWDQAYRDGKFPPWNSNMAAPDLRKAVENGDIKPCRATVLGCGSGDNAIYLAKKGFDVTAIDVAPTALSVAESKAAKEGVKVRWLLADVSALPKLEPCDLVFDRGCYHHVHYFNPKGYVDSVLRISRPGARLFILSCDRDSAPGVREPMMRADFSEQFEFEWLRQSTIFTGQNGESRHPSWSVMLRRKDREKKAPTAAAPTNPNIIYILVDDMGYGDPSCFGQQTLKTPNLDALAAGGIRFTNHYAGSTVCAPSRCVLMTGLHTGHCRVRTNGNVKLRKDDITVAQVLKQAGYATGCIGKWGVGRPDLNDPNVHGFDYFYGYVCMNHAHNCYPEFIIRNGEEVPLRNVREERWKTRNVPAGAGVAAKKVDFVPHLCQKEVIQFIDKNQKKPFFLYYALNIPHANNEGGNKGMEVPSYGEFAEKDWPDAEKGFAAMISYIDGYVKEIVDKLEETGIEKNTLVMFTSDNGPHQEGGHNMRYFDSNGPLRGMKRDLYEGGVRVPTIAHWPAMIEPGQKSDHVSGFQDIMPTLAELAGVDCPKTDGISMVPTLTGKGEQAEHEHLFWEFYEGGGKQAVLKGKWKGVRLNTSRNPDGPIELYDITRDLAEQENVAAEHPEIVADMARIMKAEHEDLEK